MSFEPNGTRWGGLLRVREERYGDKSTFYPERYVTFDNKGSWVPIGHAFGESYKTLKECQDKLDKYYPGVLESEQKDQRTKYHYN